MSEQPKTVGGIEPVICENADGTCWISGGNFRELCSDGTWVGLNKSGSVWPTREVAQRFIDRHADQGESQPTAADQPPSGKDCPKCGADHWCDKDGYRWWKCGAKQAFTAKGIEYHQTHETAQCLVRQLSQEHHQAEVYRKQMVEAEAIVKELGVQVGNLTGELEWQKKQTEYIRDLANKQRGEIESLNFMADAVERLRDIGRVIGCDHVDDADGRRQLVNCVEQVFAEVTQQLADANSRLAKVREACKKAMEACRDNLKMYQYKNEQLLFEAFNACKAALAEGEG